MPTEQHTTEEYSSTKPQEQTRAAGTGMAKLALFQRVNRHASCQLSVWEVEDPIQVCLTMAEGYKTKISPATRCMKCHENK